VLALSFNRAIEPFCLIAKIVEPALVAPYLAEGQDIHRNLTHGMLDTLGKAIVTGRYDQKPFPTEAEIAKSYGVSRSVTREAVKMLTAKGLIRARPRYGISVLPASDWNLFDTDVLRWLLERKFSIELLRHCTQLRKAIEPEAASLAAEFHDADDLAAIEAGLARMRAAEISGEDTLEADIAFHVAILRASHNPFYAQFQSVVATALHTSIQFTSKVKGRTADVAEHAAVARAIAARDTEGAYIAMRRIIGDVLTLIAKK
jgi:DNA-binding FadR family transcriptional regulator